MNISYQARIYKSKEYTYFSHTLGAPPITRGDGGERGEKTKGVV